MQYITGLLTGKTGSCNSSATQEGSGSRLQKQDNPGQDPPAACTATSQARFMAAGLGALGRSAAKAGTGGMRRMAEEC